MIWELATALHKLPSEVETITLAECERGYVYWRRWPHPARAAVLQLMATTTWKPPDEEKPFRESTSEEIAAFARDWAR